ncbi:MAG: hypothetical protein ABIL62_10615 [Planctomycetota bacterium]
MAKMTVNSLITKDYRKKDDFSVQKNKPNSNPIPRMSKMNVNSLITKDYRKNDTFAVKKNKPKTNPISSKAKMNLKSLAGKSGHTRKNLGLIFLTITLECLTEKQRFLTK